MESTSSRNRDRSCLNKLAPSAFVQALLIHVVLNTGRKLDLLFNEQPFIPLHSPCCIPIQSRVVLRSTGIKTHTIQSLRRWKSTDFQRKCCRGSLQRKPCNNFNSPQPTGKVSLLSPDLQLYFGATRRKCPIQAATYREAGEEIEKHGACEGTVSFAQELCQCLLIYQSHSLHVQAACAQKLQGKSRTKIFPWNKSDSLLFNSYQPLHADFSNSSVLLVYLKQAYGIEHIAKKKQQSRSQVPIAVWPC